VRIAEQVKGAPTWEQACLRISARRNVLSRAALGAERAEGDVCASNAALRDPAQTTLVLVARPEPSSLTEAERTRAELAQLGIANVRLILNGVFHARDASDATAVAMDARGRASLDALPAGLRGLGRVDVPLLPFGLVGIDAIRKMGTVNASDREPAPSLATNAFRGESLDALIDQLAKRGTGVIMTMARAASVRRPSRRASQVRSPDVASRLR